MPASLEHRKRMLAHLEQQAAGSRLLLEPITAAALESRVMAKHQVAVGQQSEVIAPGNPLPLKCVGEGTAR